MRKCPSCGRATVADDAPTRPFCSERCRTADLGRWLQGSYRIGSPIEEEDLDEGLPSRGAKAAVPPSRVAGGSEPFEGPEFDQGEVKPPQ
jgi:endogenous inhibitor of DNA gyrase (YacG/DUF329 family)